MVIRIKSKCGRVLEAPQQNILYDSSVWYIIQFNSQELLVASINNKDVESIERVT